LPAEIGPFLFLSHFSSPFLSSHGCFCSPDRCSRTPDAARKAPTHKQSAAHN
jgi:hypothetical protein